MSRKGRIDNILDTISPAYIRQEWRYERFTTPNPSCYQSLTLRKQLRELLPGEDATINGALVHRGAGKKSKWYYMDKQQLGFSDVLAMIEGDKESEAA